VRVGEHAEPNKLPSGASPTVTFVSYASQGWEHVTTSYQNPHNHVLHSLLVGWLVALLGMPPLEEVRPFMSTGDASVYLLGRRE
jgi:hypothetical protein